MIIVLVIIAAGGIGYVIYSVVSQWRLHVLTQKLIQESEFINGTWTIPEKDIKQKFLDVILMINIQPNPDSNFQGMMEIFDTSLYMEKQIIGLTYFVQAQLDYLSGVSFVPHCNVYKLKDGRWLWQQANL